jgi:hypothetical protein
MASLDICPACHFFAHALCFKDGLKGLVNGHRLTEILVQLDPGSDQQATRQDD